jgi:hypothetical protein
VSGIVVGYARVSTDAQDLTAQRDALAALGVAPARIYVDHGLSGRRRDRPGLCEALAACRAGDTLVVTKLDRLARSVPDARDIAYKGPSTVPPGRVHQESSYAAGRSRRRVDYSTARHKAVTDPRSY